MAAYYNELDKNAAAWLRELIKAGLIADGEVDERSIVDVEANDIRGFSQCHWFAGIGGWSYALRLAGVPDDIPVWSASLPCQSFSVAGKQLGKADERHLLPYYLELVRQCKPAIQVGEQVTGAIRHGWLDDLYTEMEACGYAVGAAIIGAHSVTAPHQRQRLYWVAYDSRQGLEKWQKQSAWEEFQAVERGCSFDRLGNATSNNQQRDGKPKTRIGRESEVGGSSSWGDVEWIACRDNKLRPIKPGIKPLVTRIFSGMVQSGDKCKSPDEEIDPNNTAEARVMRLKGYGNSIVPQVAAVFIESSLEVIMEAMNEQY